MRCSRSEFVKLEGPKGKLQERFAACSGEEWVFLLRQSDEAAKSASAIRQRCQRTRVDSVEQRAERAQALAGLGELPSARLVLDGASCAPRDEWTLRALWDPRRRPVALRENLPTAQGCCIISKVFGGALLEALWGYLRPLLENDSDTI